MSGTYPLGPGATPNWPAGYVPSAAEWSMWWSNKVDADNPELIGGPFLALAGGTMTGQLTLAGPPLQANDAVTKQYADSLDVAAGPFLPLTGGTMTGVLTLAAGYPPVGVNDAVPKQYADQIQSVANNAVTVANQAVATANNAVPRSGGTMTGYLTLAGNPMSALMAAPKQYVDNNFLSISGGTLGFLNVNGNGISYPPYGAAHQFAFGWDGSFLLEYVDGSYIGQIATVQWANPRFAPYNWVQTNYYSAGASDGRYLYKSGDTCTGSLTVNGGFNAASVGTGYVNCSGEIDCNSTNVGSGGYVGAAGWTYTSVDTHAFSFWYYGPAGNVYARIDGGTDVFIGSISDERFKTNIAPSTFDGLAAIRRIPLYGFRWQDLGGATGDAAPIGFVAQKLAEVFPEAVVDTGTVTAINTNVVLAALCDAVQKLAARA